MSYDCTKIDLNDNSIPDIIQDAKSIIIICANYRAYEVLDKFKLGDTPERHIRILPYDITAVAGIYDVAIIDGGTNLVKGDVVFRRLYPYLKDNVVNFYIYE